MNGAQWFVRTLKEIGVDQVYVLCGNGLYPFLDACLDFDVKIIDVRNEQAAAYMADTWGRFTGRLGVAAVSSGPGHTNAITGLANSYWDGGPMLLLSGCSPLSGRGMDTFQEIDQTGIVSSICKFSELVVSPETLPAALQRALFTAIDGRPGPVTSQFRTMSCGRRWNRTGRISTFPAAWQYAPVDRGIYRSSGTPSGRCTVHPGRS